MARTLTEIYNEAKNRRNQYLELTEFQNNSKMSIIDAFTWVTAACIHTFEMVLDVFKVDLAKDLQNRINGTAAYYTNALLKYQSGDILEMNDEGTAFAYSTIDETKRIITKVSYSEHEEKSFHDKQLVLKVATGTPGNYAQIELDELLASRAYFNQIAFAGTHATIVSRKGDVLIPRVTVYYDGAVPEDEVYGNIEQSLNEFVANINFDGVVYAQRIIDAIQKVEHVVDVYTDNNATDSQGIFVAQYDDDNNIIEVGGSLEQRVERFFVPNSGFVKQSSRTEQEELLPTWRESIILQIERQ